MRLRSKAREVALHLLYQIEISKRDCEEAFRTYFENDPQKQEVIDFARSLVAGVNKNSERIDSLIKKYVRNWEIDRMAVVDRNILRIACLELLFFEDIPPKVSINEAIELAKRFGDVDSSRFVNGVLDKIYRMESKKNDKLENNSQSQTQSPEQ
ncbi:MAG: transcription antitermination factor NusB [Candidatus Omnitrophica bacterium]|nr:transcription antitermination factor NusB [Candidatus Omnitrophota bacterium]